MDRDSIQIQSKDDIDQTSLQMGNYFRDGRTKIGIQSFLFISFISLLFGIGPKFILGLDFVLVWETSSQERRQEKERTTSEEGETSNNVELNRPERKKTRPVQWRERFVRNLESAGLLTEKVLQIQTQVRSFM